MDEEDPAEKNFTESGIQVFNAALTALNDTPSITKGNVMSKAILERVSTEEEMDEIYEAVKRELNPSSIPPGLREDINLDKSISSLGTSS